MKSENPFALTFVKEFGHMYLVLPAKDTELARHILKMQKHNDIYGLLPMNIRTINNVSGYYYETSGYKSILDYYDSKKLTYGELEHLIKDLRNIIKGLERYILDCDYLYLSHDCIYIDPITRGLKTVYYPESPTDLNAGLRRLATGLLDVVANDDEAAVTLAYSFYQLVFTNQFAIDEIARISDDLGEDGQAKSDLNLVMSEDTKQTAQVKLSSVITIEENGTNSIEDEEAKDWEESARGSKKKGFLILNIAFIIIPFLILALNSKFGFLEYAQILAVLGICGVSLLVFLIRNIFIRKPHILFR